MPRSVLTSTIRISSIRKENEYGGIRISLDAFLGNARIPLQFDIGIGDAITPAVELAEFPVLLNGEIPKLRVYPKETVIAEKTETMLANGFNNSRMKDFYDVWLLAQLFSFDYTVLRKAFCNTMERRGTPYPTEMPVCFSEEFMGAPQKQTLWRAFICKNKLNESPNDFQNAVLKIRSLMLPVMIQPAELPTKWIASKDWV